jgi:small neutral amino acid transporter SnatA (MarC family)
VVREDIHEKNYNWYYEMNIIKKTFAIGILLNRHGLIPIINAISKNTQKTRRRTVSSLFCWLLMLLLWCVCVIISKIYR